MLCQKRLFHLFFFVEQEANIMIANKMADMLNILSVLIFIVLFCILSETAKIKKI